MHERLVVAVAAQHDRRAAHRAPRSPRAIHAAIGVFPVPPTVRLPTLTAGIGASVRRQPAGVVQACRARRPRRRTAARRASERCARSARRAVVAVPDALDESRTHPCAARVPPTSSPRATRSTSARPPRARRSRVDRRRRRCTRSCMRANGFGIMNRSQLLSRHARRDATPPPRSSARRCGARRWRLPARTTAPGRAARRA